MGKFRLATHQRPFLQYPPISYGLHLLTKVIKRFNKEIRPYQRGSAVSPSWGSASFDHETVYRPRVELLTRSPAASRFAGIGRTMPQRMQLVAR